MATNGETVGLRGNAPAYEYVTAKKPVISALGATRSLIDSESGSVVVFDRVAGSVVTLPVGKPGQEFTFVSNMNSLTQFIVTNIGTSTPIIIGEVSIAGAPIAASAISSFQAVSSDGICRIAMNGGTTGGLQGSKLTITNLSSGTWYVTGILAGTGSLATPFSATSA